MDGNEVGALYRHARGVSVVVVALGESRNLVVSTDDSGRVLAGELAMPLRNVAAPPGQKLPAVRVVLDPRSGGAVVRLLVNDAANRLLVSGHNVDELWELPSGKVLARRQPPFVDGAAIQPPSTEATSPDTGSSSSDRGRAATCLLARSAFQHPTNAAWFVVVADDIARVFTWADFGELTSADGIRLKRPTAPEEPPRSPRVGGALQPPNLWHASVTASYYVGPGLVVELLRSSASTPPQLHVWPAAALHPSSPKGPVLPATEPNLDAIGPAVRSVVGFAGPSTLVFLDANLWVYSTELQSAVTDSNDSISGIWPSPPKGHARRHFFALSEWRNAEGELECALATVPAVTSGGCSREVVFVSGHRLVVVKGGFEFSENML